MDWGKIDFLFSKGDWEKQFNWKLPNKWKNLGFMEEKTFEY